MNKLFVVAAFGLCAVSAGAEDLSATANICAGVNDDRARLACYDGLAARAAKAQQSQPQQSQPQAQPFVALPNQAPSAPAIVAAPKAVPAPAPVAAAPQVLPPPVPQPPAVAPVAKADAFGAETIRKNPTREEAAEEVQEIRAKVTAVDFSKSNKFTVTLDNGQIWHQIEADTGRAKFRTSGEVVVISHGLLGSYNLVLEGRDMVLFKVRRVK